MKLDFIKKNLFTDILKKNGEFSQGRVYMFISVVAYFGTHGIMLFKAYHPTDSEINIEYLKMVRDGLEYAMALFGSYTFGGKFLDVFNQLKSNKNNE